MTFENLLDDWKKMKLVNEYFVRFSTQTSYLRLNENVYEVIQPSVTKSSYTTACPDITGHVSEITPHALDIDHNEFHFWCNTKISEHVELENKEDINIIHRELRLRGWEFVEELLRTRNVEKFSMLMDQEKVRSYVADLRNEHGDTALHLAAKYNEAVPEVGVLTFSSF